MYDEIFQEVNLTVVELPIEMTEDRPHYAGYLKELPAITGAGSSRKEMYQELAQGYQAYLDAHAVEEKTEEERTSLLSLEELLKCYDGESFDGFSIREDD